MNWDENGMNDFMQFSCMMWLCGGRIAMLVFVLDMMTGGEFLASYTFRYTSLPGVRVSERVMDAIN